MTFRYRSVLAMGPLLLSTALASDAVATVNPLYCSAVAHLSATVLGGATHYDTTFVQAYSPAVNFVNVGNYLSPSDTHVAFFARHESGEDILRVRYTVGLAPGLLPPTSPTLLQFSWTLDLATDVVITGMSSDLAGSWMNGSTPISTGEVFSGSSASFTWSNLSNVPSLVQGQTYEFQISFAAATVPLPGAAGLAALGLLAGGRRRRR